MPVATYTDGIMHIPLDKASILSMSPTQRARAIIARTNYFTQAQLHNIDHHPDFRAARDRATFLPGVRFSRASSSVLQEPTRIPRGQVRIRSKFPDWQPNYG